MAGLPLLEREHELARISELVERAAAGEPGFAVVEGPAGAGKSALLSAIAASAGERGVRVLRATGLELERGYPFGVVRQLFEPAMYELDEKVRGELFAGAAALAEPLLAGDETESEGLVDPGFALLHSLYWVLVGLTDLAAVALVVDDVQWGDAPSLRFLAFVLKRSEELPLLVALAKRDLPAAEQLGALAAALSQPGAVIRPAPLSGAAVGSLLAGAVGRELEPEAVAEATRLTEGNPLYVRELADALTSAAHDAPENRLATVRGAAPAAVGRRVQSALARLDAATQDVARATAIFGDEVPLRHAAALARLPYERASAAADALVRADVLAAGEPLCFRHPLVREAVRDSIEPRRRAAMHGRAAQLLLAEDEPPERAAVHLLESDPAADQDVVAALRAAAQRAIRQSAPELAISALTRALREPPDRSTRPLVLNELATVEAQVGNPQAIEHYAEAFANPSSLEQMADGAVRYAMLLSNRGEAEQAQALIDKVLAGIDDRERRLTLEAAMCTLITTYHVPGARERLARVSAGLRGQTPAERLLLGLHANDAGNAGAMEAVEVVQLVRGALGGGRLLNELGPDSPLYLIMAGSLEWLDELELAEPELAAAATEARRRGAAFGLAIVSMILSILAWKRGQLARAEGEARTAVEIATQMGWVEGYPLPLVQLVEVLTDAGKFDEADGLLEEHNLTGPLPPGQATIMLLGARGRLRLGQGHTEQGIADLEEQRDRLDAAGDSPPNVRSLLAKSLVPALMQVDRKKEARQLARDTLRSARAFGQPRYIAHVLRSKALTGPDGADIDVLSEAAAIYERIGAPIELARTLLDIGVVLRRRRRAAAAREPLRRALDLARACGAQPLAERAEHELRASGARPRRDRITGRDALTASEQRVAQLAIDGLTNRQIAETLFVTRKTVKSHLEHIFHKLGIHARTELERALAAEDKPTPHVEN